MQKASFQCFRRLHRRLYDRTRRSWMMNVSQNSFGKRTLLVGAAVSLLAGCTLWQPQQTQTAPAGVASTPPAAAAPATAEVQNANAAIMKGAPLAQAVAIRTNKRIALTQIHETDMMEIALGKMAEEKASTDEVRAYADQL